MNIFSYNFIISFFYPIIFLIGLLRLILKKESYLSFQQKFFANHDYSKFQKVNIIIHFASIGELNSIKFLLGKLNNEENFNAKLIFELNANKKMINEHI